MEKDDVLRKIYSKIDEIPTLPAVVPKLLSVMESETSNASDIANTISNDPALSSKILKVANSAYYGFSQEILSLKLAMTLLGLGQDGNPVPPAISRQDLKVLEIGENEIEEMRAYLIGVKDEIYALFDAMT